MLILKKTFYDKKQTAKETTTKTLKSEIVKEYIDFLHSN